MNNAIERQIFLAKSSGAKFVVSKMVGAINFATVPSQQSGPGRCADADAQAATQEQIFFQLNQQSVHNRFFSLHAPFFPNMARLHDPLKMTQSFNSNIWMAPDLAIICFHTKSCEQAARLFPL